MSSDKSTVMKCSLNSCFIRLIHMWAESWSCSIRPLYQSLYHHADHNGIANVLALWVPGVHHVSSCWSDIQPSSQQKEHC